MLGEPAIYAMEPRHIIRSNERIQEFLTYYRVNLPDVSDRPDIPDEKVQFWKMTAGGHHTRPRKKKKRFAATHSKLPGLMAKRLNKSIDQTIARNMWCVTFRDEENHLVSLVFDCVIAVWLFYISSMVRNINP